MHVIVKVNKHFNGGLQIVNFVQIGVLIANIYSLWCKVQAPP